MMMVFSQRRYDYCFLVPEMFCEWLSIMVMWGCVCRKYGGLESVIGG
ncbi:hypothetical protein HanOQP8_Chr02g0047491 [Helianthus annuus]|nr:hypothetical protein HanOQP8_Chr02g0047491 [Helianthus annuus]